MHKENKAELILCYQKNRYKNKFLTNDNILKNINYQMLRKQL